MMEVIYNLSGFLLIVTVLVFPVVFLTLIAKPHLLNERRIARKKSPVSRRSLFLIGTTIFFISILSISSVIAATEPESVRQERIAKERAEEEARQAAVAKKVQAKEEAREREEEAKRPVNKRETKFEAVAFKTKTQKDDTLAKGVRKTLIHGMNGKRKIVYEVTYKEGVEVNRKIIGRSMVKQPISKVVREGTYVAPVSSVYRAPTATPATPRTYAAPSVYYKNCAAARAAGAAPVYTGQPGYASHLDRDNDGIGCE